MKIGVFCSAKMTFPPATVEACRQLAQWIGHEGHSLVYGGGKVGLMGLMADEVLKAGGEVEGYLPTGLFPDEVPHSGITKMVPVADLFERKRLMMQAADSFVILPGGVGTLDEFFEVVTWRSLGCFDKPIYIYNLDGFWDSLLALLKDLQMKDVLHAGMWESFGVRATLAELTESLC